MAQDSSFTPRPPRLPRASRTERAGRGLGLSLPALLPVEQGGDGSSTLHEQVYRRLREALIVGRLTPGKALSLRVLAEACDVGVMPVREAIRRLSAEHALMVQTNRRVSVPAMSIGRFDELMQARLQLEPACAVRALPYIDAERLTRIRAHDDRMNSSYEIGDPELYMLSNYQFHFEIYRAGSAGVMVPLLESVWMQFGPFMRTVYGMVGTSDLTDKHEMAIGAIRRRDGAALKVAIEADILDGMDLLGRSIFQRTMRSR